VIPITPSEQESCRITLSQVFPGTEVVVMSRLFNRERHGQGLVVQGKEQTITTLMGHLRRLRNRGGPDYAWDEVRRTEATEISMHIEDVGILVIPRITLIESLFRADVVRFANLCLATQCRLRVVRPSGEVLTANLDLPVKRNGRILINFEAA
jgi:hypothetical protein